MRFFILVCSGVGCLVLAMWFGIGCPIIAVCSEIRYLILVVWYNIICLLLAMCPDIERCVMCKRIDGEFVVALRLLHIAATQ